MVQPSRPLGSGNGSVSSDWTRCGWSVRRLPGRAMLLVLAVDAAAAGLLLVTAGPVDRAQLGAACLLVLLGVAHTELAAGIERARGRAGELGCPDLSSVWSFAAALVLPPVPAAAVIVAVHLHRWQRGWRRGGVGLHRLAFAIATVVLATGGAHAVVVGMAAGIAGGDPTGVAAIAAAMLAYAGVNQLLVGGVVVLAGDRPAMRGLLGSWDQHAVGLATICMGALTAVVLRATPWLLVLVLPPVLVLHRAVLVRQLERAASTDAKTGLLTLAAWRARAEAAIRRARRSGVAAAVLIIDLDHFKAVNDGYGHLAGDGVLAAVAHVLRTGVRQDDLVGRFGGEEFVVLLPGLPAGAGGRAELFAVADRLRGHIAELRVTVSDTQRRRDDGRGSGPTGSAGAQLITGLSISVGGAAVPADGEDLDQVLSAADAALYAAKRAGRNLVRIAARPQVPAPRRPPPRPVTAPTRPGYHGFRKLGR